MLSGSGVAGLAVGGPGAAGKHRPQPLQQVAQVGFQRAVLRVVDLVQQTFLGGGVVRQVQLHRAEQTGGPAEPLEPWDIAYWAEKQRKARRKRSAKKTVAKAGKDQAPSDEDKRQRALDLVLETVEDLFEERGEQDKVWGSMVKQALKRRNPGFNETYHGFRSFAKLLEEAETRKLLELEHDEKSGGYIITDYVGS